MAETALVQQVELISIENRGDKKGPVYNLPNLQLPEQVVFSRPAEQITSPHWHTGKDPSYDPQVLFLAAGTMEMNFWDLAGNEQTERFSQGTMVSIPKHILHSYTAITDIVFIEWRNQPFDPNFVDTFVIESVEKWRESYGKN